MKWHKFELKVLLFAYHSLLFSAQCSHKYPYVYFIEYKFWLTINEWKYTYIYMEIVMIFDRFHKHRGYTNWSHTNSTTHNLFIDHLYNIFIVYRIYRRKKMEISYNLSPLQAILDILFVLILCLSAKLCIENLCIQNAKHF